MDINDYHEHGNIIITNLLLPLGHISNTATVAAEVRNTSIALGPELVVDLYNITAAIKEATCGHHGKFNRLNIPVKASISLPPHVEDAFPNYSTINNRRAAVSGMYEYELVEATPNVAIEFAALPGVSSFMNKGHEASGFLHV